MNLAFLRFTLLSLFTFCISVLAAQFDASVEGINLLLEDIETDKEAINQSISVTQDGIIPNCEITVETENLKKSETETEVYSVNLALLDENKLERKISKSEMSLRLHSNGGDYILLSSDKKGKKYVDEIKILCTDINMLRDLQTAFKSLIESGKSEWERRMQIPEQYTQLKSELLSFSGDVQLSDDKSVQQEMIFESDSEGVLSIAMQTSEGDKSTRTNYSVLLTDLDMNSNKVSTSKEHVEFKLENKGKDKLIRVQEEEELFFSSSMEMFFNSPSEAFHFLKLLESLTEKAKDPVESGMSSKTSCSNCIELFSSWMNQSRIEDTSYKSDGDCEYQLEVNGEKQSNSYNFHWGDLDSRSISLDFDKGGQEFKLTVNGKEKFVEVFEDGVFDKYSNEVKFEISDVMTAKYISKVLPDIISSCERDIEARDDNWLIEAIGVPSANQRYEQKLEQSDKNCSYVYEIFDTEKSKSERNDFNLYDLDGSSSQLNIKTDEIILEVRTKAKEKLITHKDEKGKLSFNDKLEILFTDLDNARVALATFREMIASCKND